MLTRREFLQAGAAVALIPTPPVAATYDLLIKGGRVLDASQRVDRVADLAISGGRITALRRDIAAAEAADVIDARGKLVTAGLVDIHAHTTQSIPGFALTTGVTTLVDGGSKGGDNIDEVTAVATAAPNHVRVLVNLARRGNGGDTGELLDFSNADPAGARRAIEQHRDLVVGVKARISRSVAGDRDLDAIRRAHEATVSLGLPLMVHVGQTASPLSAIVRLLRPGDIVTHVYAPPPNGLLDDSGRVWPELREARRRGVLFDIGNGRFNHITWEVAERALQEGFPPDTISSDLTEAGRTDRVFDLPTVLSKFLLLGMPVDRVIACATANAARAIPGLKRYGTLKPGADADVAVFELREGEFEFVDNSNVKRVGRRKLVPHAVVLAGKRVV